MRKIIIPLLMILALSMSAVFAQETEADTAQAMQTPGFSDNLGPTIFRMGIALLLIIGLIYLSVLMLKKFSNARMGKQGMGGTINVVDRHHLAPKKQICLIKVDKKYLLVGVTDQAVNLVADVSDQNFERKEAVSKPQYQGFSFKKLLSDARMNLPMFSKQAENPQKS
ncbi:MAG: flagellar biosynthetic protein FliO [candidate division Zixibacteria bacterium]|nr:flagellar biosynthetic protein FliO [candidate division Zixibacteria bacterium]